MSQECGNLKLTVVIRNCNLLLCEDRKKRKTALEDIRKELFENGDCLVTAEQLDEIYCQINRKLLKSLCDDAETCREISVSLFQDLLSSLPVHEKYLTALIPYLMQRIGAQEIVEPSEEVRLSLVVLLRMIVDKYGNLLFLYFSDIVQILSNTLVDPYPAVKKESCVCVCSVANALSKDFHMHSETIAKPIIKVLYHQQYKVRVSGIKALSDVVRFGNSKTVDIVIGPLAERLFDQNATVRFEVARAVGNWLTNFPERYSFFYKFIPLILTCLMDDIPDVQKEALVHWEMAGKQYESENENELKDAILSPPPSHYPPNDRPRIGCRFLVKNNLSKILPALIKELGDWTSEVRLKSACLLYQLLLHAENNVTLNLEKVLSGMYNAASDEEYQVVKQVEKSAELIGYFVPPNVYCNIMLPVIEVTPTPGHILIFGAILRGSPKSAELADELDSIGRVLSNPIFCYSIKSDFQRHLLKCCEAIMSVCDCSSIWSHLFRILVSVSGLSTEKDISQTCDDLLLRLRELVKCSSDLEFYNKFSGSLLEELMGTAGNWYVHSPERFIFEELIKRSGAAVGTHWKHVSQIIIAASKPDSDAQVKSKLFSIISSLLTNNGSALSLLSNPSSTLFLLVQEAIFPNLEWSAGRTASSIRAAAVSCLLSCLSCQESIALDLIKVEPSYLSVLLSLVEDDSYITRHLTLSCLCQIFQCCGEKLTVDEFNKVSEVVIKRLDDVNDTVRMSCLKAITLLFLKLPDDYDVNWHRNHIVSIYSAVLIHLDDPDEKFTAVVLDTLKQIGKVLPCDLFKKTNESKVNFRNLAGCEELLEHLQSLSGSS